MVTEKGGTEKDGTLGTVTEILTIPGVTPVTVPLKTPSELLAFTVALAPSVVHAKGRERG